MLQRDLPSLVPFRRVGQAGMKLDGALGKQGKGNQMLAFGGQLRFR